MALLVLVLVLVLVRVLVLELVLVLVLVVILERWGGAALAARRGQGGGLTSHGQLPGCLVDDGEELFVAG